MASLRYLVLCAFTFSQGALGMPATAPAGSYGTQFQTDFDKNLATVMNNIYSGATTLATPPIKFGFDTMPNLIQQGIATATNGVNKITAAGKEGLQKLGVGAGHAIGGGGVLGSSIAGGAMQVAGHGLGVGVDVANAGVNAGLNFMGHVGDNAASTISVGSTIGSDAMSTLGNGMVAAGTGVNVVSSGLSTLLDVIGSRLSGGIDKTEKIIAGLMNAGVLTLENGALSLSTSAQANVYNILNSFLQILINIQKLFDSLKVNINAGVTAPSLTGTGTASGAANTGTVAGATKTVTAASGRVTGAANNITDKTRKRPASKTTRELVEHSSEESQTEEVQSAESQISQNETAESKPTDAVPEGSETEEPEVVEP